jgi:hypothetical protein
MPSKTTDGCDRLETPLRCSDRVAARGREIVTFETPSETFIIAARHPGHAPAEHFGPSGVHKTEGLPVRGANMAQVIISVGVVGLIGAGILFCLMTSLPFDF